MNRPHREADHSSADSGMADAASDDETNAAAVTAYRASLETGKPVSERKLAAMFGRTSRRWARNRIAEARQNRMTSDPAYLKRAVTSGAVPAD